MLGEHALGTALVRGMQVIVPDCHTLGVRASNSLGVIPQDSIMQEYYRLSVSVAT